MPQGDETNDETILSALKGVIDPELGINVVDLGLVYRAVRAADRIEVAMTMTTPSCPLGEMIVDQARQALTDLFPDASDIRVELVWEPPWSPTLMNEDARRQLGVS